MSETKPLQLMSLWEDSHARTCPLPDAARDWLESDPASGSSSREFFRTLFLNGWWSRMSPDSLPLTAEMTSQSSFTGWSSAGIAAHGECWTLNASECPSAAAVCSLSDILETVVPPTYFLSERATSGIIRRLTAKKKAHPIIRLLLLRGGMGEE